MIYKEANPHTYHSLCIHQTTILGTTWSGTIQKLAMPGLLFHHETEVKDYLFDLIKPYEHYVPVRRDLADLK